MNKFCLLYKTYLMEKNIKQLDIAHKLGITSTAVSKFLKNENVTLDQMIKYADAVDCDLEIKLIPRKQQNINVYPRYLDGDFYFNSSYPNPHFHLCRDKSCERYYP